MNEYDRKGLEQARDGLAEVSRLLRRILDGDEEVTVDTQEPQLKVLPPGISWASHIGLSDFIDEFIVAAQALSNEGIPAEIAHTGGEVHVMYVTQPLSDIETFWEGLASGSPRIGITPSDEGFWLVGTYLSDEDEGRVYMEVATSVLAAEVSRRLSSIRTQFNDWWSSVTDSISAWPPHLDGPLDSREFGLNHRVTLMSRVPVLVTECDGGMTSITETRLDVFMVERDVESADFEQGFIVRWSDFVANDWAVLFDSYGEALEYQARLLYAISMGLTVDEISPMELKRIVY